MGIGAPYESPGREEGDRDRRGEVSMTHEYDAKKTATYFTSNSKLYSQYQDLGPSARDRILLEKILPKLGGAVTKVLDYGCRAGGLLCQLA